ncbi:MAG: hypothetical protein DRJ44_06690 [Thermoprotei archaeon]|nr:MAG: hypothetical protein DRJ44_06690 [Thermoprotei archaeon]
MFRRKFFTVILVLALFLAVASIPRAYSQTTSVTAIILPEKDVYIVPDDNNHNYDEIFVGREGGVPYRSLLYFNISGCIPSGAVINEAKLYLYIETISFKEDIELRVMALTAYWEEDEVTWYRRTKTESWSRRGGDFTTEAYATYTLKESATAGDTICIDLTDLVRKWKNKEIENYGIIILIPPPDEAGPNPGKVQFSSRETYIGGAPFWQAPRLHVSYTRLVPPSWHVVPHPFKPSINIPIPTNGFRLALENDTLQVEQGSFASTTLTVVSLSNPTVELNAISTHPGISVSFNTTTVTPPSSAKVTVTVDPTTPPGDYKVSIEGYNPSNGKSDVAELTVQVKAPASFTLTLDKKRVEVVQGGTGMFTIYVNPVDSYSQTVTLSVSSPISGITVNLSPSSGVPPFASSAVVNVASSAAPGTYTLNVVASGADGTTLIDTIDVVVKSAAPARCSSIILTLSPNLIVLDPQKAKSETVKANVNGVGVCNVKLSLHNVPSGVKYTVNPATCRAPCSFTIEFEVGSMATPGKYSVDIRAEDVSGTVFDSKVLKLEIKKALAGKFDYSISVSPTSIKMYQGETATATVTLNLLTGSPQPVSLRVEQCPADLSCSINPSTVTPPAVATLTVNAGSAKGTYTIIVKASRGSIVKTVQVEVTVEEKTCFIATATYGSEVAEEVQFLRRFRNELVLSTYAGRCFYQVFNAFYYSWSPYVAKFILDNPWIKAPVRILLYPLLLSLKIASFIGIALFAVNPEIAVVTAGIVASALIGLFYFTPIVLLVLRKYRLSKNLFIVLFLLVITFTVHIALAEVFSLTPLMMLATTMLTLEMALLTPLTVKKLLDNLLFQVFF